MAQKDMRVRLSAEGQADIIKAFRSVQAEATKTKQTAQDASKGFDQLASSARSLAVEFLSYEAAIRVFDGIKGAVESSLEFAASMGKLQEKTGLSATTLQVWAAAAKRADISQESVAKGLGLFSKAMGNLQQGSTKASASLKILLGSADALKGLTADEKLRKITDGLAKMSAGSQRAKITTDLFGKAGLELLPVIDQLGGQGFDKLKDKLTAFGALLSDNAIQEAKVAEETLGDLKIAGQGLAMQFTEGLLPSITGLAGALVSLATNADGGESALKVMGEAVGQTTEKYIFGAFWAATYGAALLDTTRALTNAGIALANSWHPFRDWHTITAQYKADMDDAVAKNKQLKQAIIDMMNASDTARAKAKEDAEAAVKAANLAKQQRDVEVETTAQIAAAERKAKAKLDLARATAQSILQIDQETNRAELKFEEERYKGGEEATAAYFATRRRLSSELAAEEKKNLEDQIKTEQAAMGKEKDPAKKLEMQKAIVELQTRSELQRLKSEEEGNALELEEAEARKKSQTEQLSFEDKILEAQGNRHSIAIAAIEREAQAYRKVLMQAGDQDVDAKVASFQKVMTAQADYAEANRKLEESEKKLGEARRHVQDELERGHITARQAKAELIALDKTWQGVLDQELLTLRQIAQTSGLAPLIDDAGEAKSKVDDLNASLNKTKSASDALGKEFGKSVGHELHEFLTKGVKDSNDLGKAFENLALSVAQSFISMMSKMMAKQGGQSGSSSGGAGGGLFSFLSMFGGASGKALGGEIYGPGSGTSDSVPIWASRGEFVVRSAAVAQPGVRELLHTINQGLRTPPLATARGPRFAAGGEVSGGFALGGGGEKGGTAQLTVGLDYGLLLKNIDAHPAFGRIVVKHAADNRKAMNSALGK